MQDRRQEGFHQRGARNQGHQRLPPQESNTVGHLRVRHGLDRG